MTEQKTPDYYDYLYEKYKEDKLFGDLTEEDLK